ncbi:hypothetical protein ACKC9G_01370 [Pokkaliibacter sp. CJK22405]|uniref:AtuA-related protein n=1 Tax=Pokkaliibacter sp. CJK22405 TaxID=3384615 RepID=UPI003984B946
MSQHSLNASLCLVSELAHARAGDKGNTLNVAVFAYDEANYGHLVAHLTEQAIAERFAHRTPSKVTRYLLPNLAGMNFVIEETLEGGVNASASLDRHGKSLSFLLLGMEIPQPV